MYGPECLEVRKHRHEWKHNSAENMISGSRGPHRAGRIMMFVIFTHSFIILLLIFIYFIELYLNFLLFYSNTPFFE